MVEQNRPVVLPGRLLAVRPELILDAAIVRARTAERDGPCELHVGVAHVDDRFGHPGASLPDDNRHERLLTPAYLRPLRHEPFRGVVPIGLLHRRAVFRLDPVGGADALGIAALVNIAVQRASAEFLSSDHEVVVLCRLAVRDRMLERNGRLIVAVEIGVEGLVAEHKRPVGPLGVAITTHIEQLVLVLDRTPAVCAKLA